jgi:hypothetical protein
MSWEVCEASSWIEPSNFQDKLQLVAVEVRDVGTDRHLAAKFEAEEFPVAQMLPESFLRGSADTP